MVAGSSPAAPVPTVAQPGTAARAEETRLLDLTTIAIVLDPEFGAQLFAIAALHPVWVVDSPANRPVIEAVWSQRRLDKVPREVTIFRAIDGMSPQEHVAALLGTIDAHHGPAVQHPAFVTLVVDGAAPDDRLREALRSHGATRVEETGRGFRAQFGRSLHPPTERS